MKGIKNKFAKLLFIGFGHVGQKIADILTTENKNYKHLQNLPVQTIGIITRHHGSLINPRGLDLRDVMDQLGRQGQFVASNPDYSQLNAEDAAQKIDYDILLDLSTLSIQKKGEPALASTRSALKRGKHVVSANKGPAAFAYRELIQLAKQNNCLFLHEATVMDGTPLFNLVKNTMQGCHITAISGILNSTTNFVLSQMENGVSMTEAIAMAQQKGFAERDPDFDIKGWDTAVKVTILANALMGEDITPLKVEREGIEGINQNTIKQALAKGQRIKLIGQIKKENQKMITRVIPRHFPITHPFAQVSGTGNIIKIESDIMTPLFITQQNPTLYDTAYGVLQDILTILHSHDS